MRLTEPICPPPHHQLLRHSSKKPFNYQSLISSHSLQGGFTLVEMILVLFLLGAVFMIAIPRMGLADGLSGGARKLVAKFRSLQATAIATQRPLHMHFDIDQRIYWVTMLESGEERPPMEAALEGRVTLPERVRFLEVTTPRRLKAASGEVMLRVLPTGRIEPGIIQLTDDEFNVLALRINALTGGIQIVEGRIEDKRGDIPQRLRALLQSFPTQTTGAL
ncbi:MAG: pilus assembly FimT family protein [Nitrospiraceae bacterium]